MIWLTLVFITCSNTDEPEKEMTLVKVGDFPEEMYENSGMTEYQDLLWNINDSGNEPAIFGFNKQTNTLDRKLIVADAVNTDWEEVSQDDQHLFIGDFGNNSGNRHDLRVYIIEKSALLNASGSISYSGLITFDFEDQTDFTPDPMNTPFDCEAFVVISDSLVVFTKDWQSEQTSIYILPAKPGDYHARFRKRFNVSGLVTGASYDPEKQELLLLGYRDYIPFIWVFRGFTLNHFIFDKGRRIDFDKFFGAQTEGIAHADDGSIYVSSEQSPLVGSLLYRAEI